MGSYLPKDGGSGSAYQEGGGLYALGMYVPEYRSGTYFLLFVCAQIKEAFECTRYAILFVCCNK